MRTTDATVTTPSAAYAIDGVWSLDAWVMVRPASAFQFIAAHPAGSGIWRAIRRPLLLSVVCGCMVSLMASGTLTARIAGPAAVYWAFVPIVQAVALAAVLWRRRGRVPFAMAVDAFFAGHAAWTLLLIGLAATWAFVPLRAWELMLTVWLWIAVLVLAWSAYIDFCYYRGVLGASRAAAVTDTVVHRLLTWTTLVVIFIGTSTSPWRLVQEIVAEISDVLRG